MLRNIITILLAMILKYRTINRISNIVSILEAKNFAKIIDHFSIRVRLAAPSAANIRYRRFFEYLLTKYLIGLEVLVELNIRKKYQGVIPWTILRIFCSFLILEYSLGSEDTG